MRQKEPFLSFYVKFSQRVQVKNTLRTLDMFSIWWIILSFIWILHNLRFSHRLFIGRQWTNWQHRETSTTCSYKTQPLESLSCLTNHWVHLAVKLACHPYPYPLTLLHLITHTVTLHVGIMEVVLDQKLLKDDSRGLGHGVTDNRVTLSSYRLQHRWP